MEKSHIITLKDTKKAFNKTQCLFLVFFLKRKLFFKLDIKGYFIVMLHNNYHKLNATILFDGKKWEEQIRNKKSECPLTTNIYH